MKLVKEFKIDVTHENLIMRDHTVQGISIMPGVTLIDVILRVIINSKMTIENIEIQKLLFSNPIWTNEQYDRRVKIQLFEKGKNHRIEIQSAKLSREKKEVDDLWISNAAADLITINDANLVERINLDRLDEGVVQQYDLDTIYEVARNMKIIHGPFMKTNGKIRTYDNRVLAEVHLSDEAIKSRDKFFFPPALLDSSTLPFSALINSRHAAIVQDPFIPMFVNKFICSKKPGNTIFVEIEKETSEKETSDILYNTIKIYNEEGFFIGSFEQLGAKRIRSTTYLNEIINKDILNGFSSTPVAIKPVEKEPLKNKILENKAEIISEEGVIFFLENIVYQANSAVEKPLDREAGFYQLGLDSTDLLKVVQLLEEKLEIDLYPTLLFEHKNLTELSGFILENYKNNIGGLLENNISTPVEDKDSIKESNQYNELRNPITLVQVTDFIQAILHEVNADLENLLDTTTGFYQLGLDSTDLLKVVQLLEEKLEIDLYPTLLFEYKNIEELAQFFISEHEEGLNIALGTEKLTAITEPVTTVVTNDKKQAFGDINLYVPFWKKLNKDSVSTKKVAALEEAKKIIYVPKKTTKTVLNKINKANPESIIVSEGKTFLNKKNHFQIATSGDIKKVITIAKKELDKGQQVLCIIDGQNIENEPDFIFKVHALIQAIGEQDLDESTVLLRTIINPSTYISSICGYFKSAMQELPKASFIFVEDEVVDFTIQSKEFLRNIGARVGADGRGFFRFQITQEDQSQHFYKNQQISPEASIRSFKKGGRYIITGGAGQIGLTLARYLIEEYQAKVCLFSRRNKTEEIVELVNIAKETKGKVIYVKTDITNKSKVYEGIRKARTSLKGIDGIFHCAGLTRDSRIINKTEEEFQEVLQPKIEGAHYLDEATKNEKLDVFMLFSSLSSVVGNMGQSDYAYANAYFNEFTRSRNLKTTRGERSGKSVSIAWPFWKEGGLSPDTKLIEQMKKVFGLRPLSNEEGMAIMEVAMASNQDVLVPIAGKLKGFQHIFEEPSNISISNEKTVQADINLTSEKEEIAIIGISGKFPKADNMNVFWKNLSKGIDCIEEIPKERWNTDKFYDKTKGVDGKYYCKQGGFVTDHDKFDPLFFKISPQEAENMDPNERLFIQETWKSFEDAGYNPQRIKEVFDNKIGVFVGAMWNDYELIALENLMQDNPVMGTSSAALIANRTSFYLDLNGPSVPVDTMCSSSLMALHLACQSIRNNECKGAIVGGVNLSLHPWKYIKLSRMQMLSPEGRCKTFGNEANGYVPGEGVVSLVLKPLSKAIADNDQIYATVKGTAVNHTGLTSGLTVPSPKAQSEVIKSAIKDAQINEDQISYIEAHGTGTDLGDPIEISGLKMAYKNSVTKKRFIGSVKSNIGHLEAAAGVASLAKVCMQIKNNKIVPSLHSAVLNPKLGIDSTGFNIPKKTIDWKENIDNSKEPLTAAISSFGAGGSNVSVILQEFIEDNILSEEVPIEKNYILPVSATSDKALNEYVAELKFFFENKEESELNLQQVENTFKFGRASLKKRVVFVFATQQELVEQLAKYQEINFDFIKELKDRTISEKENALEWSLGKEVKWNQEKLLTKGITSLPTYPFEKRLCWLPVENSAFFSSVEEPNESLEETVEEVGLVMKNDKSIDEIEGLVYQSLFDELKLTKEEIPRDEPIMNLGMDSIVAMRMVSFLEKKGIEIALATVIGNPTLNELIKEISKGSSVLVEG